MSTGSTVRPDNQTRHPGHISPDEQRRFAEGPSHVHHPLRKPLRRGGSIPGRARPPTTSPFAPPQRRRLPCSCWQPAAPPAQAAPGTGPGPPSGDQSPSAVHSLRAPVTDENFYFVMADRFSNGNTRQRRRRAGRRSDGLRLRSAPKRASTTAATSTGSWTRSTTSRAWAPRPSG